MGIRNGETERTVYKILNRLGREIWSVVACVLNNNASVRAAENLQARETDMSFVVDIIAVRYQCR